jgi:hypothetical protein
MLEVCVFDIGAKVNCQLIATPGAALNNLAPNGLLPPTSAAEAIGRFIGSHARRRYSKRKSARLAKNGDAARVASGGSL